jgi:hypothetical protein
MNSHKGQRSLTIMDFKEYLLVSDAAKYLSGVFENKIGESDIFELVFDGHLKLYIDIVKPMGGICGILLPKDFDAEKTNFLEIVNQTEEVATDEKDWQHPEKLSIPGTNKILNVIFKNERYWEKVTGILQLPMIGNEYYYVKNRYMSLVGGPDVTDHPNRAIR